MATAKKKPSAAQLAARKLFAARAKAGTLTKKRKPSRDYARDAAVEREEATLRIAKKHAARKIAVRKTNPVKARITIRPAYAIDGSPVILVDSQRTAKEIAEVLANYYRTPFEIMLP